MKVVRMILFCFFILSLLKLAFITHLYIFIGTKINKFSMHIKIKGNEKTLGILVLHEELKWYVCGIYSLFDVQSFIH